MPAAAAIAVTSRRADSGVAIARGDGPEAPATGSSCSWDSQKPISIPERSSCCASLVLPRCSSIRLASASVRVG
ncbi:hypothetical protein G6F57_023154 [Rhizopus arrhizus]|nr:hypothetical protein G6F65_022722 [Rhizopus arrhizus]KAG1429153.1 hypothetical protein G6F57_023154 [Rhizopus arrhizus]